MGVLQIEAGAHDNLQICHPGDAPQLHRIAADTDVGGIDDGVTTERLKALEFGKGEIRIIQRNVVAIHVWIHAQFADDLDRYGLIRDSQFVGMARAFPRCRSIQQNMLVHQGNAHFADRQRALNGHHRSGFNANRRSTAFIGLKVETESFICSGSRRETAGSSARSQPG